MFSTPRAFAFDSLFLSSLLQTSPVFFHHLSYNIWITPFSCNSKMAKEILSLQGEPKNNQNHSYMYDKWGSITKYLIKFIH